MTLSQPMELEYEWLIGFDFIEYCVKKRHFLLLEKYFVKSNYSIIHQRKTIMESLHTVEKRETVHRTTLSVELSVKTAV